MSSSGRAKEAFEPYVHQAFRHHKAYLRGDAQWLKVGTEDNAQRFPDKILDVQRASEEADLVIVHTPVGLAPDLAETSVGLILTGIDCARDP